MNRIYSLTFADLLARVYFYRGRCCANDTHPAVYSRFSYVVRWLAETACEVYAEAADYFRCGEITQFSEMDSVEFIDWTPEVLPLKHCEGDCDRDSDCAGTMICMQRSSGSKAVPGCAMRKPVSSSADFCVYPSDV